MKVHLLFEGRDLPVNVTFTRRHGFTLDAPELPSRARDLEDDLQLVPLLQAMAGMDALVSQVARYVLLTGLADPEQIAYRQAVLDDCLANPQMTRELYAVAAAALVQHSEVLKPFLDEPQHLLQYAVSVLQGFVAHLKQLRRIVDENAPRVRSSGLKTLFDTVQSELSESYFATVDRHLRHMKWKNGALRSARLGKGNRGTDYVLRLANPVTRSLKARVGIGAQTAYSFSVAERDDAAMRMLAELTGRVVNPVANALSQSADHVLSFFGLLCGELSFYVGCLNLHDQLRAKREPTCKPIPLPPAQTSLSYEGIYDVSLALRSGARLVGNSAKADGKALVMITRANSGGKSTLLRSIGQAQLMMQCGMFVGARGFKANTVQSLFTHFAREEDKTMRSGKLDEELTRMSEIADEITPRSMVLLNESFAATNEREGSEIGRQVIEALLHSDMKVLCVTHQFTLAATLWSNREDSSLFLGAHRGPDGHRTFKIEEGEPLPTSFGEDVFRRLGGWTGRSSNPAPTVGCAMLVGGDGARHNCLPG